MKGNWPRTIPTRLLISIFWILACILSASAASGQTLEFQVKVTPAYEAYLIKQAETLVARIGAGGSQERVLSDRMALTLVKLGQVHVEADRAFHRLDAVTDDVETQRDEIEDLLKNELLDQNTESPATVLKGLRELFTGSRYEDLKRRVKSVRDSLKADRDEVKSIWEDFQEAMEAHLDVIQEHTDALRASRSPFSVRFYILGGDFDRTDEFEVSRANLDDVEAVEDAFRSALDETRDAVDVLRGALEGEGGGNAAAVAGFRAALKQVRVALDTLGTALDAQPLSVAGKRLSLDPGYAGVGL